MVQFAVYGQADGSKHIYFLAIDWFDASAPTHTAMLRIGECEYPVEVRYGTMIKAVAKDKVAAWFDSEECDVLSICDNRIKVQGVGTGTLFIAKDGEKKCLDVDFLEDSVRYIKI